MKVHLPHGDEPGFLDVLRAGLPPEVELLVGDDPPGCDEAQVLVEGRPSEERLDSCPSLRHVVIPWAGVPEPTLHLLRERSGLSLHVLHHNAAATAEMAVALMLAACKRLVPADRELRSGDWSRRYETDQGFILAGRRVLVVGYGSIGRRVGATCRALGMHVTGVRRRLTGSTPDTDIEVRGIEHLRELLPVADVLHVALPLTEKTRGLIGKEELAALPDGAVVVNVGRGPIIDEEALWSELSSGRLAGAGLDVWWQYPTSAEGKTNTAPSRFDFGSLDSVVLSPHRAGHGDATPRRRAEALAELLRAAAAGEEVGNRVDLDEGY
ncbi:MAG: NAD(P)-dependent oxidoreductase [Acidobacteriota bacterium]